ncbi:MAG: biotin--[acetyl-CoA-carboxylase] ligase [Deltaproteobacteria bacterium]|nr:biotin--[acetyl-CoA-carboxylase] ligase [Deltaproteobacteria bacterium]
MKPIGHRLLRLEEATSTNTLLLENEAYLNTHGLVLTARHQTAGRGRQGRRWASIPGQQLQFSLVWHPMLPAALLPVVALVSGLAVAQALEDSLGLRPRLKWPNDVLLEGRKVCGILVESSPGSGATPRLVVGIGINCQGLPEEYPQELRGVLTTLASCAGRPVDNEEVFQAVLSRLDAAHGKLTPAGLPALLEAWRQRAEFQGRRVRVTTPGGMAPGRPVDVTPEGFLVVLLEDGSRHVQVSGDLEWLPRDR